MDQSDTRVRTAVGAALGGRAGSGGDQYMSRKGFGYRVRESGARPSSTSVRDLLSDKRYTEAVLTFLGRRRWVRLGGGHLLINEAGVGSP